MKKFFFLINLLVCNVLLYGQVNNRGNIVPYYEIFTADTLIKGIYLNLSELQNNNPTIRADFRSDEAYLPINNIYNNMIVSRLRVSDSQGDFMPFHRKHWGLCDGKHVLINFKGKYQRLSIEGRYSPFTASFNNYNRSYISTYQFDYLLDMITGKIIRFDEKSIKKILAREDPSLYQEFRHDKNRRMMAYNYITRLNKSIIYR
jgi:hypothetical protein